MGYNMDYTHHSTHNTNMDQDPVDSKDHKLSDAKA